MIGAGGFVYGGKRKPPPYKPNDTIAQGPPNALQTYGFLPKRCIIFPSRTDTKLEEGDDMRIPKLIGIIPDGNRRWAKRAGLQKKDGYAHGLTPGLDLLRLARSAGIQEITYYGFTTDNCGRPPEQVQAFSSACVEAVNLIASDPVSLPCSR